MIQLSNNEHLDFWTEIGMNRPVDIMITPHVRLQMVDHFKAELGMDVTTKIPDVQDLIDQETREKPLRAVGVGREQFNMTWHDYYSYDEVCKNSS